MKNFDIKRIMDKLRCEREIFHSEADFQFSLAWKIKEEHSDYKIFLEWPVENQYKYVDILLEKDEKVIPIELKYKTKELTYKTFNLKTHSAKDIACYDYLKDIERVESLKDNFNFEKGLSIFLTNDLGFLNKPRSNAGYKEFSIYNGRKIKKNESLDWAKSISEGTKKGRKEPITLKQDYEFEWYEYSNLTSTSSNNKFKYLLSEIKNI